MHGISKTILLLALSQLGACAVMSKNECLNADWRQVGYVVGAKGNTNISDAFNVRERTCAKHGAMANWRQFKQGHSDGIVEYCQLPNAVELGIKGVNRAIDNQVCPERDYPGFRQAFGVGYRLYTLRDNVREANNNIYSLNSRINRYHKDIKHINQKLNAEDLDKSERKHLRHKRQKLRRALHRLDHNIEQYRQSLYRKQAAASSYSDYVYENYLFSLNDEFVDPRNKKPYTENPEQSSFEDRIDELLNE